MKTVFILTCYEYIGGIFATLDDAVKAVAASGDDYPGRNDWQIEEWNIGSKHRTAAYMHDGEKWEENGKDLRYAERSQP